MKAVVLNTNKKTKVLERGAYLFDADSKLMLAGEKQTLDHTVRFNASQIQSIADTVGGVGAIVVVDVLVKYSTPNSPLTQVTKKRQYLPDADGKFHFVKAWQESAKVKPMSKQVKAEATA